MEPVCTKSGGGTGGVPDQPGQSHGDVQRAAADVLGGNRTVHHVDQGFTDHQSAGHADRLR
jgi:hypothetical protein